MKGSKIGRRSFLKSTALLGSGAALQGCGNVPKLTFPSPVQGSRTGRRVAIIGGGIGGMTAAHELVERGFDVTVFESKSVPGGKARSIDVPDSSVDGRKPLPGEHGFRFFPGFYTHIPHTMSRIPFGANTMGVLDNLVAASEVHVAFTELTSEIVELRVPIGKKSSNESRIVTADNFFQSTLDTFNEPSADQLDQALADGIDFSSLAQEKQLFYFAAKVLQLINSSEARWIDEYEKQSWTSFMRAEELSPFYQKMLIAMTRIMVAAKGDIADTKTVGSVLVQLLTIPFLHDNAMDRSLNGPTNDSWLNPWLEQLQTLGVDYRLDTKVDAIYLQDGEISGLSIIDNEGQDILIDEFDYYIGSVPVEVMQNLLNDDLVSAAPELSLIHNIQTEWMTGIQFYLNIDAPIAHGHTLYVDSPWALTSISQAQFWTDIDLTDYGNGLVKGIISVDISDWTEPGILYGKTAKECTYDEIKAEVWAQLKDHLNRGRQILLDDMVESVFLDPGILFDDVTGIVTDNLEPLVVHTADSWKDRPNAITSIPNFFLAADYVRTNTNLPTMEAANEAARFAVNGILSLSDSTETPCDIFPLKHMAFTKIPKAVDTVRYSVFKSSHPLEASANSILDESS